MEQKIPVKKIQKTITEVLDVFVEAKEKRHKEEDQDFIDPISDLFDLRLWNHKLFIKDFHQMMSHLPEPVPDQVELVQNNNLNGRVEKEISVFWCS